jgi:hypothetical protein
MARVERQRVVTSDIAQFGQTPTQGDRAAERVTKQFYDRFKVEREAFLGSIAGMAAEGDRAWYASLLLNHLMFVHFLQRRGFLDGNVQYLRDKLAAMRARRGASAAPSFYRAFLRHLFRDGLGGGARDAEREQLLGQVLYLGGGLFAPHRLEEANPDLDIPDNAFARIFDFFDGYDWCLDDRPLANERQITPDFLGHIFEKYINQKQLGAYYTKADITGYIGANTIIPCLLDRVADAVPTAFAADGPVWQLLRDNPDHYVHAVVRHGTDLPLPDDIAAGEHDVSKRGAWNRRADPGFALPTETWREYLARRAHCHDLRARLRAGAVQATDDLITLNLDSEQFAQDVIARSAGMDLVLAFYRALERLTVLDPTCGSGAFLFAALQVLRPLYAACLDRMQACAGEAEAARVLTHAATCPNRDFFILKSILLNNLHGVDLMEEAVEICKLRLFLALVAQVAPEPGKPNYGLEPLPDLDFNIRAGNALVGFATDDESERACGIAERAERIVRAHDDFRQTQFQFPYDADLLDEKKRLLNAELSALGDRLDCRLALAYGADAGDEADFASWRAGHQPFHWVVEFPAVMRHGGFDAIIGNPPYLAYSKVREQYTLRGYRTASSGNLYAFVVERALALLRPCDRLGMIVPIASVATDGMRQLQDLYRPHAQWHSHYAVRPGKLFAGVDMNLTITLLRKHSGDDEAAISPVYGTGYRRWSGGARGDRPTLFGTVRYVDIAEWRASPPDNPYPKLGAAIEVTILRRMLGQGHRLGQYRVLVGETLYYHSGGRYWRKALPQKLSSHYKPLTVPGELAPVVFALLNSQIFYWYWISHSNCMDVVAREVLALPVFELRQADHAAFACLRERLLASYAGSNATRRRQGGRIDVEEVNFDVGQSKSILDELDRLLAAHYGFTADETDAILNYDIKYRMAGEGGDPAI